MVQSDIMLNTLNASLNIQFKCQFLLISKSKQLKMYKNFKKIICSLTTRVFMKLVMVKQEES